MFRPIAHTLTLVEACVRLVDPSDVAAVAAAGRLLHDFNTEFDTPTPGSAVVSDRLAVQIGARLFVILARDPAVGVAIVSLRPNVWFDGPVAILDELYVAPLHRGQGLGAQMLTAVRTEAVRRGADYVEINVDENDHDAQRFYERHGFTVLDPDSGERAFYYSGPTAWPADAQS